MKYFSLIIALLVFIGKPHEIVFGAPAPGTAKENENINAKARQKYVKAAIEAISDFPQKKTKSILKQVSKMYSQCRSKLPSIEMECLLDAQVDYCKKNSSESKESIKNCELTIDVAMNNKISEPLFLSNHERYKVLKKSQEAPKKEKEGQKKSFSSPSYQTVVMSRYANLVTKMVLWDGKLCPIRASYNSDCLAEKISTYCQKNRQILKQTWQGCSGAMVWFIGNQGRTQEEALPSNLVLQDKKPTNKLSRQKISSSKKAQTPSIKKQKKSNSKLIKKVSKQ